MLLTLVLCPFGHITGGMGYCPFTEGADDGGGCCGRVGGGRGFCCGFSLEGKLVVEILRAACFRGSRMLLCSVVCRKHMRAGKPPSPPPLPTIH